jgi:hypothetical protein
MQADLLAGRVALALGRPADADTDLTRAAARRDRGAPLGRIAGWLAQALRAEAAGDARGTLHACRRGLAALDEVLLTLGAGELRSQATVHGTELAGCALRTSMHAGRPRDLLTWSERWRATALSVPAVRPPADSPLQRDLAALRDLNARADRTRGNGEPSLTLDRARRRLERAVVAGTRRVRATAHTPDPAFDAGALLDALGDGQLVELVAVDGELRVLLCGGGRVRLSRAGRLADAVAEVEYARALLRRLAFAGPQAPAGPALSTLDAQATRLERLLLGEAADQLRHGPVVVVPPGLLHATPFALLPCLRERAFTVAPSARAWLRAHRAEPPAGRAVVLVRGPGLAGAGAEVDTLRGEYARPTVLADGAATAERVLAALDGAWLAHVAAHGHFRADSPLFSSMSLDDGPLIVHDLQRMRRAPFRLILPSCDSGQLAAVGADELLGLAAALLPLGTASVVASVVPVNDRATVEVMLALHGALRAGAGVAEALLAARCDQPDDPVRRATAVSYVAIGAG